MTEMHIVGGATSLRGHNGDLENQTRPNEKRPRRVGHVPLDLDHLRDCVRLLSHSIEVAAAVNHMRRFVLDGGISVMLGGMIQYPNYNVAMEQALLSNLQLALSWRVTAGFVPFFKRSRPYSPNDTMEGEIPNGHGRIVNTTDGTTNGAPLLTVPGAANKTLEPGPVDENDASSYDSMDDMDSFESSSSNHEEPRIELLPQDIEFGVPELGHGRYIVYQDMQDYRRKVDYLPTNDERADPSLKWYCFTEEAPVPESIRTNDEGQYEERMRVSSPLARLMPYAHMLEEFRNDDMRANKLATMPVVIEQPIPPVKGSMAAGAQALSKKEEDGASKGGNAQQTMGLPHRSSKDMASVPQLSNPNNDDAKWFALASHSMSTPIISQLSQRQMYIRPGYSYAGLVTPHAYPRLSDRHFEFLTNVSIEFGIPSHVLLPGKSISSSSSGGMSGASAGGKKQQAAGNSSGAGMKEEKASSSSSSGNTFSADPAFNNALALRDDLRNFFQGVMSVLLGDKLARYILQDYTNNQREHQIREKIILELDERIKKAQDSVVKFGAVMDKDIETHRSIEKNIVATHVELSDPKNAIPKTPPPGPDGKPGKATETPTPKMPMAEEEAIPTSPEVQALSKRRFEVFNDMQAISAALQQLQKLVDKQTLISIEFRQPFVNDTGNLDAVISMLGLAKEQQQDIARRRFGLTAQ